RAISSCHRNDVPRATKEQTWRQTGYSYQIVSRVDFMKAHCAALLLVTLSLGGCCLSGSGCNTPPMATTTSNLDGLGQPPTEDRPAPMPKQRVSKRTKGQGDEPGSVYSNPNIGNEFEDDDARLKRKLIICQGCAVSGN